MELKPGYKQTEFGEIPVDWVVQTIKNIATVVRGGSPRPAGDPKYFEGSFIPWLTVASLTSIPAERLVVSDTATSLTEAGSLCSRILAPGTLIIANSGATLGVAKILGIKCCANDGIAALQSLDKSVSAEYVAYYINTQTKYLREVVATGNGQPNLNTGLVGDIALPIPLALAEQQAIAEAISDVDGLIESIEQLVTKKCQIKQGVMQELLTGRRRLPGFSKKWECMSMGELFNFSGGFAASRDQLSTDGYCYLHYGDIHMSDRTLIRIRDEFQDIPKLNISLREVNQSALLDDGDVVFVDASEDDAGISKYVVVSNPDNVAFISGLHTIVAKSKVNSLDDRYKRYCFQAPSVKEQFRFYAVGTKVSGISKSNIAKVTIQVPPLDEQATIASILTSMDDEIYNLKTQLQKARELKQGMMQELLTGRIRLV